MKSLSEYIVEAEQDLAEKAKSRQQQKFFGMVHAMQKGKKIPGASPELKKVARTMGKKDVEDYAKTKHKGLPKRVESQGVAEGYQLNEGAIEKMTAMANKIPGFGKYYQMAQKLKPEIMQILKTSRSGEEVKQKMQQLAAQQPVAVGEAGMLKTLGGFALGGASIASVLAFRAIGLLDGVYDKIASGNVADAVAASFLVGVGPVGLMLMAFILMFRGAKESSAAKAREYNAQLPKESVAESRLIDESGATLDHVLNRFKHETSGQVVAESVLTDSTGSGFDHILKTFSTEVREFEKTGELDSFLYDALFDYYLEDMPYGIAKARTGDPYDWVSNRFEQELNRRQPLEAATDLMSTNPVIEEPAVDPIVEEPMIEEPDSTIMDLRQLAGLPPR